MEGIARAQKRGGERMRDLPVGHIEFEGPWEHWHGAAPHTSAQFLQLALQPTGTLAGAGE
jgi:hypothetical protein